MSGYGSWRLSRVVMLAGVWSALSMLLFLWRPDWHIRSETGIAGVAYGLEPFLVYVTLPPILLIFGSWFVARMLRRRRR